jgi:hypothetical protein
VRDIFEWGPRKANENLRKHGIGFERAAELFLDPLARSVADEEHSDAEKRWVTMGRDGRHALLVLVHTFAEISPEEARVRLISARRPTKREAKQYEGRYLL